MMHTPGRLRAELWLIVCSVIWASSFPVIRALLTGNHASLWGILVWRFLIALVVTVFLFRGDLKWKGFGAQWRSAIWMGVLFFGGFLTQILGLKTTTSANSAFISTLFVIFVPFMQAIYLRRRPGRNALIGVALATVGLLLMADPRKLVSGDVWSLGSALVWTVYIVELQRVAARCSLGRLLIGQFAVVTILSSIGLVISGDTMAVSGVNAWVGIVHLGLLCTLVSTLLHNKWQPRTTPTRTALIFTFEPTLAGAMAWMTLGEVMTTPQIIGAMIILGGILSAELLPERSERGDPNQGDNREHADHG